MISMGCILNKRPESSGVELCEKNAYEIHEAGQYAKFLRILPIRKE